jgi:choline monooxygenase
MASPAFEAGRIVVERGPGGEENPSGRSEHAVHHFHGLLLDAYRQALE